MNKKINDVEMLEVIRIYKKGKYMYSLKGIGVNVTNIPNNAIIKLLYDISSVAAKRHLTIIYKFKDEVE